MSPSLGTLIQSWRRSTLLIVASIILASHILGFFTGLFWAPNLYQSAQYKGALYHHDLQPIQNGNPTPLKDTTVKFTFPGANGGSSEIKTLSNWNWRVLASFILDISFLEKLSNFSDTQPLEFKLDAHLHSRPINDDSPWVAQYDFVDKNRSLDCSYKAKNNESDKLVCTLTPLLDLQLVRNQSYLITLNFNSEKSVFTQPGLVSTYLTTVIESSQFHDVLFYMKCLFTPLTLLSLVYFCTKIHLNDLYISIPDRLLIACGVCQFLQNIPTEILVDQWSIPHIKLMDDLGYIGLISCLYLFWIVYTKDKLARNEAWERNTRYYWKPILIISIGLLLFLLKTFYAKMPGYKNPFNNHWSYEKVINISLGFIFSLAICLMMLQTYVSVLIFRVLCDISISYPAVPKAWRIKMVLLYCFGVSLLTSGGFLLNLALELSLYLNSHFHFKPLPYHMSFASAYYLGLESLWNIHVIGLLIMLSRKSFHGGFVQPVRYDAQRNDDFIDDDGDLTENKEVIHLFEIPAENADDEFEYVENENNTKN